ncbi:MAG: thioredoxin domain-containing protein [Bacteroidetes bacterium]|nr:thioredoxin domain-containing protein [Bacteroidota bacterium]
MSTKKSPNQLIHETSPYLLQHAHNPVNWLPFSDKAFDLAKKENKPLLISIGYSACHWCHVMEHESFEDENVAALMNEHFINVKVDREERADVDMLYMQAVQLMTGQGGWPLNCFVLPDGKPFYGGTYFRKEQWINILQNLAEVYKNDKQRVEDYARQLTQGIQQAELITTSNKSESALHKTVLKDCIAKWKTRLDNTEGGANRAPKFPLPNNYQFLLRYALLEKDQQLLDHVNLTLSKMAMGGIYDQLHGGFARYSTDTLWKIPHFEKMLYDNAQLMSLYCEAYTHTKNELYKETVLQTLDFVAQEWYNPKGFFYSAYDADSEGEEGKYYVWNKLDLEELLGEERFKIFSQFYEINEKGYWEQGNYILMRSDNTAKILTEFNLTKEQLNEKITECKNLLKQEAKSRLKPALDDKTITSWNAMMCSAFAKAFLIFKNKSYKDIAISSAEFLLNTLSDKNGKLFRTYKNGQVKINGFLEDYAFVIEALMNVYLITQNEMYLQKAKQFCELTLDLFHNPQSEFLFYTDKHSQTLVARTTESSDNVIPASNSQMALNLFYLAAYFDKPEWKTRAEKMLSKVLDELKNYGAGYSNWGCLALHLVYPFKEVAIVGKDVDEKIAELYQQGIVNAIFAVHGSASSLPLLKNRFVENKTLFYVCENNACKLPVNTTDEALQQLA